MVASVYQTRAGTPRAKMLCHTVHQFIFLSATNFDFDFFGYLNWQVEDFYKVLFSKTVCFSFETIITTISERQLIYFPG